LCVVFFNTCIHMKIDCFVFYYEVYGYTVLWILLCWIRTFVFCVYCQGQGYIHHILCEDLNDVVILIDGSIIYYQQIKNSTVPTYFTNRALCHLKLKKWNQAILDCRQALDLDANLVKGHFFHGQALLEQECYDEAIAALKRGMQG